MSNVVLHPATLDRFQDLRTVLGSGGGGACACQYWRMSSSTYSRAALSERYAKLRAQTEGTPVPGLLAYVDDVPAGWCGFGFRDQMARLVRSRTIPRVHETPVLSIVCFTVRIGYRRLGLARVLLDGVVEYAREYGVAAIEAYPIDPAGKRVHGTAVYVGTTTMFEDAGFTRVTETAARSARLARWLMRLDLGN